jgi:hypothetical protein
MLVGTFPNHSSPLFAVQITAKSGSGPSAEYQFNEVWRGDVATYRVPKEGSGRDAGANNLGYCLVGELNVGDFALARAGDALVGNWELVPVAPSSLTVKEVDGSPSVSDVTTLEFHQDDGFVVSEVSPGVARIDLVLPETRRETRLRLRDGGRGPRRDGPRRSGQPRSGLRQLGIR